VQNQNLKKIFVCVVAKRTAKRVLCFAHEGNAQQTFIFVSRFQATHVKDQRPFIARVEEEKKSLLCVGN
jgi:hypothetical protein